MKFKKRIVVEGIPIGVDYRFPYPYINATSLEDALQNRRVGVLGLLNEGDSADDDDETPTPRDKPGGR